MKGRSFILLAISKLGDESAAYTRFTLARGRRKDAFQTEVFALRAWLRSVAPDFAHSTAVAGSRDPACHGAGEGCG